MRSKFSVYIGAVAILGTLATAISLAAQESEEDTSRHHQHHHYKLIDLGTFGGSFSATNMDIDLNGRGVNQRATTIGYSATSAPKLPNSNPIICGGDDGWGSFITHAFRWHDGAVTDLGALPPNETDCSNAYQVNGKGEIAGFSENGNLDPQFGFNQSRAVRWKDGKIEDLGSLGGNQNEALAINNRGQIVGFSLNTIQDPFSILYSFFGLSDGTQTRAFLWQDGKIQDLKTLGGNDAFASYINDRGQIAGFSYTSTTANPVTGLPPLDPFLWDNGKMIDLGTLGGAYGLFTGFGGGLNNHGQVIGSSSIAADPGACISAENDPNCHPFLWDSGKMTDLATTTVGASPITADAINDGGEIAGGADFSAAGGSAFGAYLWRNGIALKLGAVNGDCFSRAIAMNNKTQIVGNSFFCNSSFDNGFDNAFLWEDGSIVNLNALIPSGSSLTLVATNDINDRGEIAGEGLPSGCSDFTSCGHAFLLIPCDANHPSVEGCDYTMEDGSAVETSVSSTPVTRKSPGGTANPMLRRFGSCLMPSQGGLAPVPQK